MRDYHFNSTAAGRSSSRSRRLVFEPCERRDLLSAAGVGDVSVDDWLTTDSSMPVTTYDQLTDGIVIFGEWFDSGGQNDSDKPLLSLVYNDDGGVSFVLSSSLRLGEAGVTNAFSDTFSEVVNDDQASDPAELAAESLISVLPLRDISPLAPTPDEAAGGSLASEPVDSISLREAMAELEEPGASVAWSTADAPWQFAEATNQGAARLSPAQRVRLHQGTWDRAWAFEMSGLTQPAAPNQNPDAAEPHFESAFQEFPTESPRGFMAAATSGDVRVAPATDASSETLAAGLLATGDQVARRPDAKPVTLAAEAVDQAIAADEVELQRPPSWLAVVVERNQEIGAMALAAVVARQAWLHAKPEAEKRETARRLWPRRR